MNIDVWITGINIAFLVVLGLWPVISAFSFFVQFFTKLEKPRRSK